MRTSLLCSLVCVAVLSSCGADGDGTGGGGGAGGGTAGASGGGEGGGEAGGEGGGGGEAGGGTGGGAAGGAGGGATGGGTGGAAEIPVTDFEWVRWALPTPIQTTRMTSDGTLGVVTDSHTGLVWERSVSALKTWANAASYCEDLELGGETDWRMPTNQEMRSIIDLSTSNPAFDLSLFPGTPGSGVVGYWTSTPQGNANSVFITQALNGAQLFRLITGTDCGVTQCHFVRCVRVAANTTPHAPPGRYTSTADTVTDTVTGRMWEKAIPPDVTANRTDHATAVTRCEDLTTGGHTDWRLPAMEELDSLGDVRAPQGFDETTFTVPPPPTGLSSRLWASNPGPGGTFWQFRPKGENNPSNSVARAFCVR